MATKDPQQSGGGFFPGVYQSALSQSAKDYDSIMGQYKNLADRATSDSRLDDNLQYSPISPTFASFSAGTPNATLSEFSRTGGFSDSDISNIRARDVAPTRSIYASAQRGLDRQKNLQGGYAPNFGAASAKMARESSNLISGINTASNANIAEMVNRNKLAAATPLASISAQENAMKNEIAKLNATIANTVAQQNKQNQITTKQVNQQNKDTDFDKILKAIQGQQSTYGTTPAIASTFGNQVLNAANTVSSVPVSRGSLSTSSPLLPPGGNPNIGWRMNTGPIAGYGRRL